MSGLLIGLISFLTIGAFHPIVIKTEYYFGAKVWPLFLVCGIICSILSILATHGILKCGLGVLAFSLFWSIKELKEQEKRVAKGWFPANPNKKTES